MLDNFSAKAPGENLSQKFSVLEIRERFDQDVERFSRLETGQHAIMDAVLILELVTRSATTHFRPGDTTLDLSCGAGNFALRILQEVSPQACHLVDLSQPMLERARERIQAAEGESVPVHQTNLWRLEMADDFVDYILAGAALHHLRDQPDWVATFTRLHRWLKPSGRGYVAELVVCDEPLVQKLMCGGSDNTSTPWAEPFTGQSS